MIFEVQDPRDNSVLYEGESWPMARAAMDHLVLRDVMPCLFVWEAVETPP